MTDEFVTTNADLRPRTGVWAWVLVIVSVLVPVLGAVVIFLAEVFAYHWYRKQNDRGAVNSRNAANWSFTYALISVILMVVFFADVFVGNNVGAAQGPTLVLFIFILGLYVVVTLVDVVFGIMGVVAAVADKTFDTAFAVRVVRGPRSLEGNLIED